MTRRNERLQFRYPYQARTRSIDAIALAAALVWVGATVLFGLHVGISLTKALERAIVGAILVYALVFVGLHVLLRVADNQRVRRKTPPETADEARRSEETASEKSPPATKEGA